MSLPIEIEDGRGGTKNKAMVTKRGQLVVAPLEFSITSTAELAAINTAYNLASPIAGKQGVITDIILSANKDVGVNGSLIEVYETDSATSTTVIRSVITFELPKNDKVVLTGLNWTYSSGVWLNIKCNDNTVYATLAGYYIEED